VRIHIQTVRPYNAIDVCGLNECRYFKRGEYLLTGKAINEYFLLLFSELGVIPLNPYLMEGVPNWKLTSENKHNLMAF
jgi:hypothetical protein